MTKRRLTPAAALAAALAIAVVACDATPPWLTMPSPQEHAARFFPTGAGSPHGAFGCNDCHGATGGFGHFDCLGCHTGAHASEADVTARHAGIPDFRWESGACYRCHRNGVGVGVDHEAVFPIATGKHAIATCAECHVQAGDRSVLGCAGCHGHEEAVMADQHRGRSGYVFESRGCLGCHSRGQGN